MPKTDRRTYRHRNSKQHQAAPDLIHTFWVGQRVIRSSSRQNFIDLVDEAGTVVQLPEDGYGALIVQVDDSLKEMRWSPTEATPYRVWAERNARRLRKRAQSYSNLLKSLDENGLPIEIQNTTNGES